jgi:formylglycine-generating enzyme required for sulfatase activity
VAATAPAPSQSLEINAKPKLDTRFSPPPEAPKPVAPPPAVAAETVAAPAAAGKPIVTTPAVDKTEPAAALPADTGKQKKKKGEKSAIAQLKPLSAFRDCDQCPEMTALAEGSFTMGAPLEPSTNAWERPAHAVQIAHPFAIARRETSVAEWRACVAQRACPADGTGREAALPVINVSWQDTQKYLEWLSKVAGRTYRLPTEAEWEYAARGGTAGSRYWGEERSQQCEYANGADQSGRGALDKGLRVADCDDRFARLAPVGTFKPNDFGLFDTAGNVWEWVQDCWHDNYDGAPHDGRAIDSAGCPTRVIRGGSWRAKPEALRSFSRGLSTPDHRGDDLGFRVATE